MGINVEIGIKKWEKYFRRLFGGGWVDERLVRGGRRGCKEGEMEQGVSEGEIKRARKEIKEGKGTD